MKKYVVVSMLMLSGVLPAIAQNVYYDALKIRKLMTDSFPAAGSAEFAAIKELLVSYSANAEPTDLEIGVEYKSNPFIRDLMRKQGFGQSSNVLRKTQAGKLLTKVGGLDVTNYADGLATFMVERAKEELNVAFFQKFRNYLDRNPEISTLFPETSEYISNMLAHEYAQLLNGLRDSFHEDLKNLLNNLDDVFLLPRYEQVVNDFPEILIVIRSIQIVADLEDNAHPADIIREFRDIPEWSDVTRPDVLNLYNFLKTTSIISDAVEFDSTASVLMLVGGDTLRQNKSTLTLGNDEVKRWKGKRNWIAAKQFEYLFRDEIALKLFLGLVYQRFASDSVEFSVVTKEASLLTTEVRKIKPMTDLMSASSSGIFLFRNYFLEFLRLAEQTEDKLMEIKDKKGAGEKIAHEDYFEYISAGIDLVEYGLKVSALLDENKDDGTDYVAVLRTGNNLYRNIVEKNYSSAITNALKIVEWVTEVAGDRKAYKARMTAAISSERALYVNQGDKEKAEKRVEDQYTAFKKLHKLSRGAVRYGVFMANVVDADSPEEVNDAIRNAALPVGSSSYKKYQQVTLSINSYLGGYHRLEYKRNPDRTWEQNLGVIAPVGLALNFGLVEWGSVSLFAPLFDVGAIAEFRLNDDGTAIEESIKLGNILSPGGYVVWGLPANIPLAIGVGTQYGPGLYEIKTNPNGQATNSYERPDWRMNIFLAVDIPLFNLTPGRKKGAR